MKETSSIEGIEHVRKLAAFRHELYMERVWIEDDPDGFTGWRWDKYKTQLKIVCAANRYKDFIVLGMRHHCVQMRQAIDSVGFENILAYCGGLGAEEQGFIDQYGTFHDRATAAKIAIANGQAKEEEMHGEILFSEDLY